MAKKTLELMFTYVFEALHDLKARCKKARSPDLTPTQVWRPERSERVSQETNLLICQWFSIVLLRRGENAKTIMYVTIGGLRRVRMNESSLASTAGSALAAHT